MTSTWHSQLETLDQGFQPGTFRIRSETSAIQNARVGIEQYYFLVPIMSSEEVSHLYNKPKP